MGFRSRSCQLLVGLLGLVMLVISAPRAEAVVRNWNNAAGGSADVGLNWMPAGVPGAADNLIFPLASGYTVTFPSATVPLVISHDFRNGSVVTISTDGIHTCSNSFGVGQLSTGSVNIVGGTFRAATIAVGSAAGIYGRLTMANVGGLPAPPSPILQQNDSTSTSVYGNDGLARIQLMGGSVHTLEGAAVFANTATSRCTLSVTGRNSTTQAGSSLRTTNPRRNVTLGGFGQFVGTVDNAGTVQIAGPAWIGLRPGGTGILKLGTPTTVFPTSIRFDGLLRIGDTGFAVSQPGTGEVQVFNGTFSVGGLCTLGDPDGSTGPNSSLRVFGGEFRAEAGFTRYSLTDYQHLGGLVHMAGGAVTWPGVSWNVTSTVGSPELWFSNGQATGGISLMRVGRSGTGVLRVTQPGTAVAVAADLVVGDSLGGSGAVELDSSAVVSCFSPMMLGREGAATVSIRGGSHLGTNQIFMGYLPGSASDVSISGAGSTLQFGSLYVCGDGTTPGGPAHVLVDSSGVADGGLGPSVSRLLNEGSLDVRHGGLFRVGQLDARHLVELDGGTIETNQATFSAASTVHGRGSVIGEVTLNGVLDARRDPGTFGRLGVQGNATCVGTVHLGLGRPGGAPRNDTLSVTQQAGLLGQLALEPDGNFRLVANDTFVVMTWGTRLGAFSAITWRGGAATDSFDVTYQANRLVLVARTGALGVEAGSSGGVLRFRSLGGPRAPLAFSLELPEDSYVRVALLDVTGRVVARVHEGALSAGVHRLTTRAGDLPAGTYFASAVIEHGGRSERRTLKVARLR